MTLPLARPVSRTHRRVVDPLSLALAPVGGVAVWLSLGHPVVVMVLVALGALAAWVVVRPAVAAFAVIVMTPLTAGIDRGAAIPVLRPNEALAAVVGAALLLRGLASVRQGSRLRVHLSDIDRALLAMAVASSLVPLLWMSLRQQVITRDDLLYSLVLWKFGAVYLIVRTSLRTERDVRRCLHLSIAAATVVGSVAVLQALDLLQVRGLLATYYIPNGHVGALAHPRGGSTLALPAAVADLMVYNLALVVALVAQGSRHRLLLSAAGMVFVLAALSAGEFSSAGGLAIGIVLLTWVLRRPRLLLLSLLAGPLAVAIMWPVITARLTGFQGVSGLPASWTGRLHNLESYFWPGLFSHDNYVLGVRPSARVAVPTQATGYVWIESGYTWLLWGGGIPLFLAFLWFVAATLRRAIHVVMTRSDAVSAAATGLVVCVTVMAVLMFFDPHLTYRGSGDALFAAAALAQVGAARASYPMGDQRRRPAGAQT